MTVPPLWLLGRRFGVAATHSRSTAKARTVDVFDFLTGPEKADVRAGTLLLNVRPSLEKAFAASKHVRFPPGSYYLGDVSKHEGIFSLNGEGGELSILSDGFVKLVCNTTDHSIPQFFRVADADGVKVGTFHFEDRGYDNSATSGRWKGAAAIVFHVTAGGTKTVRNIEIEEIHCRNMVQTVLCQGNFPRTRIENIKVGKIHADNCYYGFNCQNNGDHVQIGELSTRSVKRSYFVYGVTGHKVHIVSTDNQRSTGDVNISCNNNSTGTGSDTGDLNIYYRCVAPRNSSTLVNLNIFGEERHSIHDIVLHLDIESHTRAEVVAFKTYTSAGIAPVRENTGPTNNVFSNIRIDGNVNARSVAKYIDIGCQPTTKGNITIGRGIDPTKVSDNLTAYFNISWERHR